MHKYRSLTSNVYCTSEYYHNGNYTTPFLVAPVDGSREWVLDGDPLMYAATHAAHTSTTSNKQ